MQEEGLVHLEVRCVRSVSLEAALRRALEHVATARQHTARCKHRRSYARGALPAAYMYNRVYLTDRLPASQLEHLTVDHNHLRPI